MTTLSKSEFEIVKQVAKYVDNLVGDTITKYICNDSFDDKRAEKRQFLTRIEVDIRKDIARYIKVIEDQLQKESQ